MTLKTKLNCMSDHELHDETAESLERAGLWRRAAARWLTVLDMVTSDIDREQAALRREACLQMSEGKMKRPQTDIRIYRKKTARMMGRLTGER